MNPIWVSRILGTIACAGIQIDSTVDGAKTFPEIDTVLLDDVIVRYGVPLPVVKDSGSLLFAVMTF
jgi:hypothetical protein